MDTLFACRCCHQQRPLETLLDLDCHCCICAGCAQQHIVPQMVPQQPAITAAEPAVAYSVGDIVRYIQRSSGSNGSASTTLKPAKVVQVDRSIQPHGYGVLLEGAAGIRFTEGSRLLPLHVSMQETGCQPVVRCPLCAVQLSWAALQRVAPQALQQLEQALTELWMERKGIISCPVEGCGALIEKIPGHGAASARASCTCDANRISGSAGQGACSSCRAQAQALHRYRCSLCSSTFCDSCRTAPWHEGFTCREARAPRCPFCDVPVLAAADLSCLSDLSSKQLKAQAAASGADASWCLDRAELEGVCRRAAQVCGGCRERLAEACTRRLPCGHTCGGLRHAFDTPCLPCLQPSCGAAESTCCFCLEPLTAAAVIRLGCGAGHLVHKSCAEQRLKVGCPGPALSFDFLFCPLCSSGNICGNIQVLSSPAHLDHEVLQPLLQQHQQLRAQVVRLAKERLKLSGQIRAAELQPGGRYDGRPADYALSLFQFFKCARCKDAYYGGARECAGGPAAGGAGDPGAAAGAAGFDAEELQCGRCLAQASGSAGHCPVHGAELIQWKCRYCCNIASWFCWGSTHMCSSCHDHPDRRKGNMCKGRSCALAVPHPEPGTSCCLGCGLCGVRDM